MLKSKCDTNSSGRLRQAGSIFAAILLVCASLLAVGCTSVSKEEQLEALEGRWEISEMLTTPRGDFTETLRSRYDEGPTLTFRTSESPRFTLRGVPSEADQEPLNVQGRVEIIAANELVLAVDSEREAVWVFDFETGTRLTLRARPGPFGPAPVLAILLPTFSWTENDGATLLLERLPD